MKQSKKEKSRCLCNILFVTLFLCRLFGIAPITWSHPKQRKFIREDGQCLFKTSKLWLIYSIILLIFYNSIFLYHFEVEKEWNILLNSINAWVYYTFSTILSVFGMIKAKPICKALNGISILLRSGLFCSFSKESVRKSARLGFILLLMQLLVQFMAFILILTLDAGTDIDDTVSRIVHNVPFMFYYLYSSLCAIYVALFNCFDSVMFQTLNYDKLKINFGFLEADNLLEEEEEYNGFNTMQFTRCKGYHLNDVKNCVIPTTLVEDLDNLRKLHESIRNSMNEVNDTLNPQISIHLGIELGVIIMHIYAVILYINIADKSTEMATYYCIDWLFMVVHSIGLMIFLLSSQSISVTQSGPMQQLIQLSQKALSPEEEAQLRLFQIKMYYVPADLIANGFFSLKVSLLQPITGAVVTYLLVALQFKTS